MESTTNPEELLTPRGSDRSDISTRRPLKDSSPPDDNSGPKTGYPVEGSEDENK